MQHRSKMEGRKSERVHNIRERNTRKVYIEYNYDRVGGVFYNRKGSKIYGGEEEESYMEIRSIKTCEDLEGEM